MGDLYECPFCWDHFYEDEGHVCRDAVYPPIMQTSAYSSDTVTFSLGGLLFVAIMFVAVVKILGVW
jgi:hypothetical protein